MKLIATFGSLKKGFYNYERFEMGEPLARSTVKGAMYLLYSYPHLYREEVSEPKHVREHEVEIYEVSDELYSQLAAMELGAGYQEVETTLRGDDGNDYEVIIFYSEDDLGYKESFLEEYTQATAPQAWVADKVVTNN